MKHFVGKTLRWDWRDGVVELMLDASPPTKSARKLLADLEKFAAAIPALASETAACIISSARKEGFPRGRPPRTVPRR